MSLLHNMASSRQLARLAQQPTQALLRLSIRPALPTLHRHYESRGIATSFLEKTAAGEERWAERAEKIRTGELPHLWDILEERGYIKDVAGYEPSKSMKM